MLVTRIRRALAEDDSGSAIVAVLVIMLVLSIGALTTAIIVTNTTGVVVDTRSTTQSRAAADAGLSDAITLAKRSGSFCGAPTSGALGSGSSYSVTSTCDTTARTVTFTSVGTAGGRRPAHAPSTTTPPRRPGTEPTWSSTATPPSPKRW